MRVFAVSDVHVDYEANAKWIAELSTQDYRDDFLILAGDVSDSLRLLEVCLTSLAERFRQVFYVPGNHELWVIRDAQGMTSIDKFQEVCARAARCGASLRPFHNRKLSIVPLLGWYDYSFGEPGVELKTLWMDFRACRWPAHLGMDEIVGYFAEMNQPLARPATGTLISFSHFLPRIDIMPPYLPRQHRMLYPVLGSTLLGQQIKEISPDIHVYGHSHLNRRVLIDGVTYINNALGYPSERKVTAKCLLCIHDDD